jgi:hypothetical protein
MWDTRIRCTEGDKLERNEKSDDISAFTPTKQFLDGEIVKCGALDIFGNSFRNRGEDLSEKTGMYLKCIRGGYMQM